MSTRHYCSPAEDLFLLDYEVLVDTVYAELAILSEPKPYMVMQHLGKYYYLVIPQDLQNSSNVVLTQVTLNLRKTD